MNEAADIELVITPAPDAAPLRWRLTRVITTIGSAPDAHIRLFTVPAQWLTVRLDGALVTIRNLEGGARQRLSPGQRLTIGQAVIAVEARRADEGPVDFGALAAGLSAVETPEAAFDLIARQVIIAARAESAAVIVREGSDYKVAAARDTNGPLEDAGTLLSDTIVRDVLQGAKTVSLADPGHDTRYGAVRSVVAMRLRTVMCLPMTLESKVVGCLFLGRRDARRPFGERVAADLRVLCTMAAPIFAQLRRAQSLGGAEIKDEMLGESVPLQQARKLLQRVGPSDLSVLVQGDSGTGKELAARAIHAYSPRADETFVALNCAAVSANLLDAELFGYKKGAFTGAVTDRKGLIEAAHGSTLFLDEVGDMPLPMQAALLRVLEAKEVKRLGETQPRAVDFRLVAATHRDLDVEVAEGRFRADLLYRLREITVKLPRLADRGDDLMLLAHFFLRQAERQFGLNTHRLSEATQAAMHAYAWPGNVRELRASMRRAALLADGDVVGPDCLQLQAAQPAAAGVGDTSRSLAEARDAFVREYIFSVLAANDGNRETTAAALGIGERTLYRHLSTYGE